MALADSITALGTAIINLVGTRLNRDANNFSTAGTQNLNNMIDSRIGAVTGAPVGTVIAYMGTDEPEGFLLMDGRELSRTTYAALFAVIGTSQGAGNGSTTFNIADMTDGRYLMGSTVAGSSVEEQLPNVISSFHNRSASNALTSPKVSWGATFRFKNGFSGEMQITEETTSITGIRLETPGLHVYDRVTLNLAQGNSVYAGSNVQPMSLHVKFFIRY